MLQQSRIDSAVYLIEPQKAEAPQFLTHLKRKMEKEKKKKYSGE